MVGASPAPKPEASLKPHEARALAAGGLPQSTSAAVQLRPYGAPTLPCGGEFEVKQRIARRRQVVTSGETFSKPRAAKHGDAGGFVRRIRSPRLADKRRREFATLRGVRAEWPPRAASAFIFRYGVGFNRSTIYIKWGDGL